MKFKGFWGRLMGTVDVSVVVDNDLMYMVGVGQTQYQYKRI
jgi:hypothetical protein